MFTFWLSTIQLCTRMMTELVLVRLIYTVGQKLSITWIFSEIISKTFSTEMFYFNICNICYIGNKLKQTRMGLFLR